MPIYEYDCADCGNHFEIVRSMSMGAGAARCTGCGSERVRRDYSGIAVLHRGNGQGGASSGVGPAPGALREADPRQLTSNVASNYANQTGDRVMREIARQADRGTDPDRLHDLVREVKADRESASGKRGVEP